LSPPVIITLVFAGRLAVAPSAQMQCGGELGQLLRVENAQGQELPIYHDADLVGYLARLGRRLAPLAGSRRPLIIVPVLSDDPEFFESHGRIFISTRTLLEARSETDLLNGIAIWLSAFDTDTRWRLATARSMCQAPWVDTGATFSEIRKQLAKQIQTYKEWTARKLRRRRCTPRPAESR